MAFLLAGLTALFYGSSHFAGGMATRRAPVLAVTFWANLVGLAIVIFVSVMHNASGDSAGLADHAWGALTGVAGLVGVTLYFQGLARGQMAVVAPLSAVTQAIVPFLFGTLIGERHGPAAWMGVAMAVPALWLTVHRRGPENRPPKALYGLAAGLAFSLFFVAISRISPEAGFWPLVTLRASGLVVLGIVFAARREGPALPAGTRRLALLSGGYTLASLTYLLAVQIGPFGLVTVAASFYPAVTVLLALLVGRERIPARRITGLALSVAALALITSS